MHPSVESMRLCLVLLCAALGVPASAHPPRHQDVSCCADRNIVVSEHALGDVHEPIDTSHAILAYTFGGPAGSSIYSSSDPIYGPKLSGDGKLVAFDTGPQSSPLLRVIDLKGRVVGEAHIQAGWYLWHPTKPLLAVRKDIGEHAAGIWIYDVNKGSLSEVIDGNPRFGWGTWDGRLYLQSDFGKVVAYDPESGETVPTDYHGVNFSNDGQYYFYYYVGDPLRLFERMTNTDLTDKWPILATHCISGWEWLGGHVLALYALSPHGSKYPSNYVFDCDSGIARKTDAVPVTLLKDGSSIAVITQDWQLKVVELKSLEIVTEGPDAVKEDAPSKP